MKRNFVPSTEKAATELDGSDIRIRQTVDGLWEYIEGPDMGEDWNGPYTDAEMNSLLEEMYEEDYEEGKTITNLWGVPKVNGISVDNGRSYCTPAEAIAAVGWDTIVAAMDDKIRETVHAEMAPCTNEEFIVRYLDLAPDDLVIG